MTITFKCDRCSNYMTYEEERSVLFNSIDKDKRRDLCPECAAAVDDFIETGIVEDKTPKRKIQK